MHRRLLHIDVAKVLASHLIVLHHFTVYGPLADALDLALPRVTDWFFEYARMAVQVFLVIGGYFAASSLAAHGHAQLLVPWRSIARRFVRLILPLGAALLLTMACSAVARAWVPAEFVPTAPSVGQLLAHATLTYDVLGIEPLSVGIWYVAIDFQLFALMATLLWMGGRRAQWLVAAFAVASLLYFNRHSEGDVWALYFFGSYAMGAFAWWAGHARQAGRLLLAMVSVGALALAWDFRERIALALVVALWLGVARSRQAVAASVPVHHPVLTRWMRRGGRGSYALFLIHFPVLLLANALWVRTGGATALQLALVMSGSWVCCVVLASLFERYVERPLATLDLGKWSRRAG